MRGPSSVASYFPRLTELLLHVNIQPANNWRPPRSHQWGTALHGDQRATWWQVDDIGPVVCTKIDTFSGCGFDFPGSRAPARAKGLWNL